MSQTQTTHNPTVEHLQKLHRRRMALFGSIILIAGIAIGAASTVILMPPKPFQPDPGPTGPGAEDRLVEHLDGVLDLTEEQKEEIRQIAKTAFEAIQKMKEEAREPVLSAIKKMNDDISAILTEEQKAKWKRDMEEWQKRFRDRWHRGDRRLGEGGPGPGEGGPGPGRPRGPGEPDQFRRGPGDPNRPPREFDGPPRGERFGEDRGQFGRGRWPEDANSPGDDFGGEPGRDRFRGRPGPFGPGWRRGDPNNPPLDMNSNPAAEPNSLRE